MDQRREATIAGSERGGLKGHIRSCSAAQPAAGPDRRAGPGRLLRPAAPVSFPRDVVIAADNAVFSITEVRWGLTAAIIIPRLRRHWGPAGSSLADGRAFLARRKRPHRPAHEVPLADLENAGAKGVEHCWAVPGRFGETKRLAWSSFGGMSVEDDTYALVRCMRKAPDVRNLEGLASFAENARRSGRVARHNREAAQQPRQILRRLCKQVVSRRIAAAIQRPCVTVGSELALCGQCCGLTLVTCFPLGSPDEPALLHRQRGAVPIRAKTGTRIFNVGPFLVDFQFRGREQHQACVSVRVLNATYTVSPR